MIRIKYELYTNDYWRNPQTKTFYSLSEFCDWIFECCDGNYKEKIFIPNPDRTDIWYDGPSRIEINRMWTQNNQVWIHQIESDAGIIFSDGKHTDGIKHWNETAKQMCRDLLVRRNKPSFNFA